MADLPVRAGIEEVISGHHRGIHLRDHFFYQALQGRAELLYQQLRDKDLRLRGIRVFIMASVELFRLEVILPFLLITQRQKVGRQLLQVHFLQIESAEGHVVIDNVVTLLGTGQQRMYLGGTGRDLQVAVPERIEEGINVLVHGNLIYLQRRQPPGCRL